jgi:hypothetical protein
MTMPDMQILSVVQIALIGILVVIGMFLMWRKIQRLEQKVEAFIAISESSQCFTSPCYKSSEGGNHPTYNASLQNTVANEQQEESFDEESEEALMQALFQEGSGMEDATATFMVFTPYGFNGSTVSSTATGANVSPPVASVKIEEVTSTSDVPRKKVEQPPTQLTEEHDIDHDGLSEVPTEKGGVTRTKLTRMNVDRLKELCTQHEVSVEGTRKQLMDRLVEKLQL